MSYKINNAQRKSLIKCLSILFIIVELASVFIVKCSASSDSDNQIENQTASVQDKFCETPGCIHAASSILKNMNSSVDPCENFYEFACGGYVKNTFIPDDKPIMISFMDIIDKIPQLLKENIENDVSEDDIRPFQLLQSFFNTCMDAESNNRTSEIVFREIRKELGGWPVLEGGQWDEMKFDWKQTLYKLRNLGYSINNYLIDFSVSINEKNNTRRIITLDQPHLGLGDTYLLSGLGNDLVKAYFKYMTDFAITFGADETDSRTELKDVLDFEIELAKIFLPREQRRNKTILYNLMTINELQIEYPSIPWLEYINNILPPNIQVDVDEQVVVVVPSYFKSLPAIINKTPKRVLANYILWRVAEDSENLLGEKVKAIKGKFRLAMLGTEISLPRWKECIDVASRHMSAATSALYVRKNFDESAKENVVEIVKDIKESAKKILKQADWMDQETIKASIEKLDSVHSFIAYPSELLNDYKLEEYFKNLSISSDSHFTNQLSLNLFNLEHTLNKLKKPVNKTDWADHSSVDQVNAYYNPTENSIEIIAGILQGVFFSHDRPNYLNYGGIGSVIGHEMSHAFDDEGSQYDKDGNLVNWWHPDTKAEYLNRTKCIIDQYNNYYVEEVNMTLNGIITLGENVADIVGIKEAYLAYKMWEQRNGRELRLPGLHYTSKQLFWIGAANSWCSKRRTEFIRQTIIGGSHALQDFRVIGPFSSVAEFAKDFNCPVGSFMNPTNKCSLW